MHTRLNIEKKRGVFRTLTGLVYLLVLSLTTTMTAQPTHPGEPENLDDLGKIHKFSHLLVQHLAQIDDQTLIHVEILATDTFAFRKWCINQRAAITGSFPLSKLMCYTCRLTKKDILLLNDEKSVVAVELIRKPTTELKQEGLDMSLNEINLLHAERKDLAGTNDVLSIKENLFDTTDIDFRGRYFLTSNTSSLTQTHATAMATIAAGGGNADPTSTGVAWDALLTSAGFDTLLPNADSYFETYDISVQNHSYGTAIENYYGIETMAYDASCERMPSLVHVFSSGNEGNQSPDAGTYAGLTGWANITGQFKQSKNTLTVGATDSLANVVSYSSRGPAYDGRIKPEVVSYGHGGTSGSAALLSGLCILLQEEYKRLHADQLPPASLIKAIVANTAKDIGRPGPDFETGFGSVRAYEAVKTIDRDQIETGEINHGDIYTPTISIPEGIRQIKITVAWTDPAASVDASHALVNDLDMELREVTSGQTWQPWVLNHFPQEDSLKLPAKRGMDSLNNIEQITLDNPVSGEYEIRVYGKKIRNGSQTFSVTWRFEEKESFQWVFPTALDNLRPDQPNIIRWNGGGEQKGRIEYKPVEVEDWQQVADEVDPLTDLFKWKPSADNGLIQLRWTNTDTSYLSDTFVVADQVRPKVGFLCPDSLLFYWSPDFDADSFEILALGEKHLEHVDFTKDTFYIEHTPGSHGFHYAVAPIFQGVSGPRSYGFDFRTQGAGCYINQFYLRYVQDGVAYFEAHLGTLYNVESAILEKRDGDMYTRVQTLSPVTDTKLLLQTDHLDQGANYFHLVVVLRDGSGTVSEDVIVYHTNDQAILIFPNPAFHGSEVQILSRRNEAHSLTIFDIPGREVIHLAETTNPQSVDISGLAPGGYVAILHFEDGSMETASFIISD